MRFVPVPVGAPVADGPEAVGAEAVGEAAEAAKAEPAEEERKAAVPVDAQEQRKQEPSTREDRSRSPKGAPASSGEQQPPPEARVLFKRPSDETAEPQRTKARIALVAEVKAETVDDLDETLGADLAMEAAWLLDDPMTEEVAAEERHSNRMKELKTVEEDC